MVLTALIIFLSMVAVASVKNDGLPDCISRCYYLIGDYFMVGMFLVGILMMFPALNAMDSPFAFFMCSGICFVGAAPNYLDLNERKVHYVSAVASALCSIIFVSVVNPECLIILLTATIGLIDKDKWLFWCELPCFISVFVSLLI